MQLVSFEFLVFLIVTTVIYYILPAKIRYIWLFAASLTFYLSHGAVHTVFLIFSILTTWVGSLIVEKSADKPVNKKITLAIVLILNLAVLLFFKYAGFFSGGRIVSPVLPIGISFYMFQSAGYLIDVYRGDSPAEKNPVRYALFVSFFPTILSGPIERSGHLLPQFRFDSLSEIRFDTDRIRDGMVRMLRGYFCKLVLADRLAIAVDAVYASPGSFGGSVLFLTSILYTLQIWLDFAGYTSIAAGAAKLLGIEIMENFNAPYLARSIADFWRRWHISLSSWFRDYLYIPLGGNRKGQARKVLNLMIVFVLSGLWHGAGWTFLIWGALHGVYQVAGSLLRPLKKRLTGLLPGGEDGAAASGISIVITFLLVNFAWIFFRMDTLTGALTVIKGFSAPMMWQLTDGTLLRLGLTAAEWRLLAAGVVLVTAFDVLKQRGRDAFEWIKNQSLFIKWPVYILAVLIVLVCGIWGPGYDASSFIYYRF